MRLDLKRVTSETGKIGYIILWLLGVPIPILLVIFLLRGCNSDAWRRALSERGTHAMEYSLAHAGNHHS